VPRPRYPFLDHDGPIAFAHRGGAAGGLENSLPAFARALDLGFRYLETDVHATADGVLLAFHDHRLDRVTDRTGEVARLPWATVSAARIGGQEPIPLLEDLLGTFPEARVNIDVKEVGAVAPLVRALRRTRALDRVCVASFSGRRLAAVRDALGPRLCTALSPSGAARLRLGRPGGRDGPARAGCAQLPDRLGPVPVVTPALVARAHQDGLPVHVWTVDDPARMTALLDAGVDGLMSDDLVTLRDVLRSRGTWAG